MKYTGDITSIHSHYELSHCRTLVITLMDNIGSICVLAQENDDKPVEMFIVDRTCGTTLSTILLYH